PCGRCQDSPTTSVALVATELGIAGASGRRPVVHAVSRRADAALHVMVSALPLGAGSQAGETASTCGLLADQESVVLRRGVVLARPEVRAVVTRELARDVTDAGAGRVVATRWQRSLARTARFAGSTTSGGVA